MEEIFSIAAPNSNNRSLEQIDSLFHSQKDSLKPRLQTFINNSINRLIKFVNSTKTTYSDLKPRIFGINTLAYATIHTQEKSFRKTAFLITIPAVWFVGTTISSIFVLISIIYLVTNSNYASEIMNSYSIFSSKPLTLGANTSFTQGEDSRSARIDQVFKKYDCPLAGLGKVFVEEADKNNIPFWLVAAVSFQESSCGKKIPYKNGKPSYNAWGWAVYGDNVKMFDNWEHGIKVVSKYMNENFYSKGVTEPCVIMKTYTPPSKGSWCKGVEFFGDVIENYQTP